MDSALHYVVRQPKTTSERPPLLILLHGYGSHEMDLYSFASELPDSLLIVSFRAPLDMGFGGYAWYEINLDASNNKHSDIHQARISMDMIHKNIEAIKNQYDTDPNKTFVLGFSQGAILSYALSFHYPNSVQYVVALSGYINKELIPADFSASTTEYYISHGSVDQVLPVQWAREAGPFLSSKGIHHEYHEYPVGHGVAPQNFYSFRDWIIARL